MHRLTRQAAWERWLQAAGPWRGWCICPALALPRLEPGIQPKPVANSHAVEQLAAEIGEVAAREPSAILLDLDPAPGVLIASRVYARRQAHTVLVLPRWPYADAVLPADHLLGATLAEAPAQARAAEPKSVVFVLDADRSISVNRPTHDPRADNRYELSATDLPSLAALRRAAIGRVVKFSRA